MRAEQVTDPIVYHGEGPAWSPSWGGLRWADMLSGDILTLRDDRVERRHVAEVAAAVRPRRGGGAVIGIERGFALEGPDGQVTALPEVWASPGIRMNEGGCDPQGNFWCGSMAYDQSPGAASLYRLSPAGRVDIMLEGVTVSNGLEWSPDGSLVYYNDTPTGQVAVFDFDPDEGLRSRRVLAELPDGGRPDGLTVDSEGCVWTAVINQGMVHRYRPDGTLDGVIEVPAGRVTACTLGGENLDRLFITTSQENVDTAADPLAGALFVAEVGVTGLPLREFAG
ncbi:SMP-30/gluconolactonase/LRE family protein [Brevibacterium sp. UCMA 11752]|uniref:SMP-30/gluconolactonase/LRE family protein n=1 Tax=Brevibacterium sp. UCMA 11752 TaxID=2745946 RepID=UPI001F18E7BE|nr:SMP-30/gluconolactonase/LRE family protein [Brevibacterium sp. UCMA 11752]MCF2586261.1 SMP-30/gluconolactonase/LRE family protein [Brevibacterium sp. UCMA 11752]